MTIIGSTIKRDKKAKKTIYSFMVNDDVFEAYFFTGKKPALEIMHNGALLGFIEEQKTKFEFVANPEVNPVKITAWIDAGNSFSSIIKSMFKGVGIEVDGKPVQNTVTDPGFHIKNGRSGYSVLLFVFGVKSLFTYYTSFEEYASYFAAVISSAIYFVPFLLLLAAFINYARWTTFAIFAGLILSVLEFVDYIMGIPNSIRSGANGVSILIWMILRIMALYLLFNALKWKNKQKERPASPDVS
jgi:hypothetical protein